jgi:hypothetical protein
MRRSDYISSRLASGTRQLSGRTASAHLSQHQQDQV